MQRGMGVTALLNCLRNMGRTEKRSIASVASIAFFALNGARIIPFGKRNQDGWHHMRLLVA